MNIGEWLQLATWDVKAFFGDDDARSHADSLRQVNSQATEEDRYIYNAVQNAKIQHKGIIGAIHAAAQGLGKGVEGLFKMTGFLLRYFPWILLAVGLMFAWTWIAPALGPGFKGGRR